MSIRELPTIEEGDWEENVIHPLQSFSWGTIREETGVRIVRFGEYENDILKNVYLMTLHKVPVLNCWVGYVPRSKMPTEGFLEYLKTYCKQYKIIFVKFEPEAQMGAAKVPKLLPLSPHPLFYKWTRIIDLAPSLEDLKKNLESNTRYNAGLAERKGVVVSVEDTEQGFETFYSLYESTTRRQHFGGHTRRYHHTIWKHFHKHNIAHILVARLGSQPLAACEVWLYKDVLYYTYAGSSPEHRNLKAMNALLWNVIKFGKEHGATTLDLWGILPPGTTDEKDPWAGFSDFKKGFGGEAIEMIGSYDLVIHSFFYALYNLAYSFRKIISRLK